MNRTTVVRRRTDHEHVACPRLGDVYATPARKRCGQPGKRGRNCGVSRLYPRLLGRAYPGAEIKIIDEFDLTLPSGQRGEICVRAPNVMQGYLNRPEDTSETLEHGWLHTGDIGYLDDDGFLYVVDRKRDLIIKGGYNIYPREIEDVIYKLPQVAEAAVVGIEDEAKGEQVRAVISVRPGEALEPSAIEDFLSHSLAKYKLPNEYVFMAELPKGPSGKILKRELRG